ncbi:MAG: helicase-related protein [Fimbriimonas sp.]
MSSVVHTDGPRLSVEFRPPFSAEDHARFLDCKRLPEKHVVYDRVHDTYFIESHSRFAHIVGAEVPASLVGKWTPSPHLFDYQRDLIRQALAVRRFAFFWDCGLGKTTAGIEFAIGALAESGGGKALILAPLNACGEWEAERAHFYPGTPIARLRTGEELRAWLTSDAEGIALCNTEKLGLARYPEFRFLTALVLDESSILKSGGGVTKWNLIHSSRGIPYKLSLTATPAPNDTMEFASQMGWLEKLRDQNEILWTFFSRDEDTQEWIVKPHAREAFYRFMAGSSVFLRDPSVYGWKDNVKAVPEPIFEDHAVLAQDAQIEVLGDIMAKEGKGLIPEEVRLGVASRSKLSQAAKGFLYHKAKTGKEKPTVVAVPLASMKPDVVADRVKLHTDDGLPTIVWTIFREERKILAEKIQDRGIPFAVIDGETPQDEREEILRAFKEGRLPCLMADLSVLAYGVNLQVCGAEVFSGFNDSYELFYQAVRRAFRYGQTKRVRIDTVFVPELEGPILANVFRKRARFEDDAAEMERCYALAMREVQG